MQGDVKYDDKAAEALKKEKQEARRRDEVLMNFNLRQRGLPYDKSHDEIIKGC